jgi:hypothetical protein
MWDGYGGLNQLAEDEMQGFAKFLEDGGTLMYFNLGT